MDSEETTPVHTPALIRARAALRFRAKRALVDSMWMTWRATGQLDRALRRHRVQVLVLHYVDDSMIDLFRSFLRQLSKHVQFVSYSRAIESIINGAIDQPMISLSFDDGFASCVRASSVMDEVGVKGMFFVNPRIVGETRPDVLNAWRSRLRIPHNEGFMNWDECAKLISSGHEIGNHSMDHFNLGDSGVDLIEQIGRSREMLIEKLGNRPIHFAWPFGSVERFSCQAKKVVFETGHASCASSLRGSHIERAARAEDLCVRRDHVWFRMPVHHNIFLLARSAKRATANDNNWPSSLM